MLWAICWTSPCVLATRSETSSSASPNFFALSRWAATAAGSPLAVVAVPTSSCFVAGS